MPTSLPGRRRGNTRREKYWTDKGRGSVTSDGHCGGRGILGIMRNREEEGIGGWVCGEERRSDMLV